MALDLNGKSILITGGTGSFGKKFVEMILKLYQKSKLKKHRLNLMKARFTRELQM